MTGYPVIERVMGCYTGTGRVVTCLVLVLSCIILVGMLVLGLWRCLSAVGAGFLIPDERLDSWVAGLSPADGCREEKKSRRAADPQPESDGPGGGGGGSAGADRPGHTNINPSVAVAAGLHHGNRGCSPKRSSFNERRQRNPSLSHVSGPRHAGRHGDRGPKP